MAYDNNLAERVRKALGALPKVEEKKMMGGLTFSHSCIHINPPRPRVHHDGWRHHVPRGNPEQRIQYQGRSKRK